MEKRKKPLFGFRFSLFFLALKVALASFAFDAFA